jgi:hypothetical protein
MRERRNRDWGRGTRDWGSARGTALHLKKRRERMQKEIKSFKDLIVWQKGMDLVVESYRISRKLPRQELFGLASQIQ